jgi:hypothetical protein
VPTNAEQEYFIYFHTFGPTRPMFDKSWVGNDVEKLD